MDSIYKNSNAMKWTSYIIQGLLGIMFLMGAFSNILGLEQAVKGAADMGYAESSVMYLGIIFLVSTLLYLYPKTSVLGAAFITAWLGGAVATHFIHNDPIGLKLAPVVFGILVWVALWLRNANLRAIFPLND